VTGPDLRHPVRQREAGDVMTGRTLSEDCRLHGLMMPMPDAAVRQCWYCARDAAPGSPWVPLDPDGLPPQTFAGATNCGGERTITGCQCAVDGYHGTGFKVGEDAP